MARLPAACLAPLDLWDCVVLGAPLGAERPAPPPEEDPRAYVERIFASVDAYLARPSGEGR